MPISGTGNGPGSQTNAKPQTTLLRGLTGRDAPNVDCGQLKQTRTWNRYAPARSINMVRHALDKSTTLEVLRPMTAHEQELVDNNLGLARMFAWRFAKWHCNAIHRHDVYMRYTLQMFDDIYQDAVIGLCIAAQRFDPSKEVKFGTYAAWWMRACIQRLLFANTTAIGSKSDIRRRIYPTMFSEIEDRTSITYHEQLAFDVIEREQDDDDDGEISDEMHYLLGLLLTTRERTAIERRVFEGWTLQELADSWNVSKERSRQIYQKAIDRLKESAPFMRAIHAMLARRKARITFVDLFHTNTAKTVA